MFAENLKSLRTEKNLTQSELAKIIGVSQGTIYFWESKTNEPTLSYTVKLANFFGVTLDDLVGEPVGNANVETTISKYYKLKLKDRQIVDNLIQFLYTNK